MTAADLKAAGSVHISGAVTDSGSTIGMNITASRGKCSGTMSQSGMGSFKLVQIGKTLWIKPDKKFWQANGGGSPAVLSIVEGKWLKTTTAKSGMADLVSLCNPAKLASGLFSGGAAGFPKGQTMTFNGQRAIKISDTADSANMIVSDIGTPELLRINDGSGHHLDFTRYNAPLRITIPPASDTLDGAKYGF